MSVEKLNVHDLIAGIARQTGETKKDTELFLRDFVILIQEALLKEELVKIKGLGTFKLQWNESRKSVNVNTGEDIEIPGHYKVVFTAENELKDFVNEPYAHLETVILDGNEENAPEKPVIDPLRNFSEQAKEIASLLSDLKTTNKKEDIPFPSEAEKENNVIVETKFEKSMEHTQFDSPQRELEKDVQRAEMVENDVVFPENKDVKEETEEQEQKPKKKRRFWKVLLIILLLLAIGGTISYFLFPKSIYRDFIDQMILKRNQVVLVEEKIIVEEPVSGELQDQSQLVPVPEEIQTEIPVSFRFNPSNYEMERVVVGEGARLAWYSTKHYGSYMFWPYIYIANMDILPKPDNLEVGMTIKVPKLPKEMIDTNNPKAVEQVGYVQAHLDEYK